MTYSEVKRMCEDIEYYAGGKLKPADEDEFKRIVRRVRDDEDLDSSAARKLQDIYNRYVRG